MININENVFRNNKKEYINKCKQNSHVSNDSHRNMALRKSKILTTQQIHRLSSR